MTVHELNPAGPRKAGARKTKADELREALADLIAFHYADDLTVQDRLTKHHAAILRAKELVPDGVVSAAMDRMFAWEAEQ